MGCDEVVGPVFLGSPVSTAVGRCLRLSIIDRRFRAPLLAFGQKRRPHPEFLILWPDKQKSYEDSFKFLLHLLWNFLRDPTEKLQAELQCRPGRLPAGSNSGVVVVSWSDWELTCFGYSSVSSQYCIFIFHL